MRRALLLSIALAVSPAAPAAARGGSLLSGYGGPGQGEQVLLGTQLFGGSGSRPAAPRRATSPSSIAVAPAGGPPPAAAPSDGTPTRSRSRGRAGPSRSGGQDRGGPSGARSGASRSGSPGAGDATTSPAPAVRGDRRPGSAGLPLDATQGVVALLLALGLITIALATPRLARRA